MIRNPQILFWQSVWMSNDSSLLYHCYQRYCSHEHWRNYKYVSLRIPVAIWHWDCILAFAWRSNICVSVYRGTQIPICWLWRLSQSLEIFLKPRKYAQMLKCSIDAQKSTNCWINQNNYCFRVWIELNIWTKSWICGFVH